MGFYTAVFFLFFLHPYAHQEFIYSLKKSHKRALFTMRQKGQGLKHPFGPFVCTCLQASDTCTEHWYVREKQKLVQELESRLQLQQNLFTKATAKSDGAVKASFIVAEEITRASKCFSESAYLKVCEQVCFDQTQTFNNISLSRNAIAD